MKLWAVVIGKKGKHLRYVARESGHLAIYETRGVARTRKFTMIQMGYESVYVVPLVEDK